MRIQLPWININPTLFNKFIDKTTQYTEILVIEQQGYRGYEHNRLDSSIVAIPDTIANLTEVKSISISAWIETLPKSLSQLKKLELLDLTGCYNIQPPEVLAMPNLKVKIGDVTSLASEVFVIRVPSKGISKDLLSVLSDDNKGKISQLIINPEPSSSTLEDEREDTVIWPSGAKWEGVDIRDIPSLDLSGCSNLKHFLSLLGVSLTSLHSI